MDRSRQTMHNGGVISSGARMATQFMPKYGFLDVKGWPDTTFEDSSEQNRRLGTHGWIGQIGRIPQIPRIGRKQCQEPQFGTSLTTRKSLRMT